MTINLLISKLIEYGILGKPGAERIEIILGTDDFPAGGLAV